MNFLKLNPSKIYNLIAEDICENCGAVSKTALCATCHDELIEKIHASTDDNEEENENDDKPKLM